MEACDEYPFFPDGTGALQRRSLLPRLFAAIAEIAQCAYEHIAVASYDKAPAEICAELAPYLQRIERCVERIREELR